MYERLVKRPQDAILATISLLVLSPVLLTIAGLIKWKIGGPVLFKQKRPGKDGVIFEMVKFRTMTDERDEHGDLLPDEVRLTPFGQTLRSLSLDELPSLLNIVKGDIAVVGPRPLLVEYLPRYNDEQRRRHDVRPGLTGLAQVSGRNRLSWSERFALDVKYVDNVTFLNDWKIILQTVGKVLKKDGISSDTAATMEAFMGNER
ncbi:MAG: sugar transferase [Exiguobacterium chiriqhucha]|uniref:sugar transferase n=1 Tax=Exiguobacterium chiriqhucha TaxID=1385984 RepID=UPI00144DF6CF|nr:sugar transferase [Exiguobacterium chiriqhucha]KAB2864854.1 MAG: sugar transferase [Exiguobacterium chiriqhucha]